MTRFRIALVTVLALTLVGCANPRPTLYDDPASGLRCLEIALSGCIRYSRDPRLIGSTAAPSSSVH